MKDVQALIQGTYKLPECRRPPADKFVNNMAVTSLEMNPVELAYARRPVSPNYRIYSDQEVNGQQKERDFIGPKYQDANGVILFDVNSINSLNKPLSPSAVDEPEYYCICREPYDPNDNREKKKMF